MDLDFIKMLEQTKWILLIEVFYVLLIIAVCLRIILDTRSVSKTLAYLLFVIFVPVIGIIFYFSFGINYRKRKIYSKKLLLDDHLSEEFRKKITASLLLPDKDHNEAVIQNRLLIKLLTNPDSDDFNPVFYDNEVEILVNGETFFPALIRQLKQAENHIHIEFYIYEDDKIGNEIKDILIQKAKEGVEVRFIYDDFGSKDIRRSFVKELNDNGVKTYPFNKIRLILLANRINYRNHRKIVVIDGTTSFIGGINVSDKYINNGASELYWRDTHLMIKGNSTYLIQKVFLLDWNFCSNEDIGINLSYFPPIASLEKTKNIPVQIISSGPDSESPYILHSIIKAISLAQQEVLITTPYYIPDETLQETLILTARSGVEVKLLVPETGDSAIVNLASQAYFEDLLKAGVKIYLYKKGFVHAKTFVTDRKLASVGTANLDLRSFDLNFEVSAIIYDTDKAAELTEIFYSDIKDAEELSYISWSNRPKYKKIAERLIRLFSPFM